HGPELVERTRAEEQPSQASEVEVEEDDERSDDLPTPSRAEVEPALEVLPQHAVACEQDTVVDAPQHEGPGRAVPQAAEHHREHQIRVGPTRTEAIASQRDVQVVAQPGRERDVPP